MVENEKVTLYTPNPEAIFGASYIALSPEHYLVHKAIEKVMYVYFSFQYRKV